MTQFHVLFFVDSVLIGTGSPHSSGSDVACSRVFDALQNASGTIFAFTYAPVFLDRGWDTDIVKKVFFFETELNLEAGMYRISFVKWILSHIEVHFGNHSSIQTTIFALLTQE